MGWVLNDMVGTEQDRAATSVLRRFAVGKRAVCGEVPRCDECHLAKMFTYPKRRTPLRERPDDDQPREKYMRGGPDALSHAELLAIIIRDGTPKESAVDLGRRLLERYGSLSDLATRSIRELMEISGIGEAKATQIKAAFELAKHVSRNPLRPGEQFRCSQDIFEDYASRLEESKKETFFAVLLDQKHRVIRDEEISIGTLTSSVVHPREAFTPAVRESAAAVIFVHNHPSGDPAPSQQDLQITTRLREAGDLLGIRVLDHIIIGRQDTGYYSFADSGVL